jgi:hypothetical protein
MFQFETIHREAALYFVAQTQPKRHTDDLPISCLLTLSEEEMGSVQMITL